MERLERAMLSDRTGTRSLCKSLPFGMCVLRNEEKQLFCAGENVNPALRKQEQLENKNVDNKLKLSHAGEESARPGWVYGVPQRQGQFGYHKSQAACSRAELKWHTIFWNIFSNAKKRTTYYFYYYWLFFLPSTTWGRK